MKRTSPVIRVNNILNGCLDFSKKSLLGILLSVILGSTALADHPTGPILYGPGAQNCTDYLKGDEKVWPLGMVWIEGYVSARGVDVFKTEGKAFDPLPDDYKFRDQALYVFNFCNANPTKDLSDAAESLVQHLKAMEAVRN